MSVIDIDRENVWWWSVIRKERTLWLEREPFDFQQVSEVVEVKLGFVLELLV